MDRGAERTTSSEDRAVGGEVKRGEVGGFQGICVLRVGLKDGRMRRGGRVEGKEGEDVATAKVFFSSATTFRGSY